MMFKHYIGDAPKPISELFQTKNNFSQLYGTRSSQPPRTAIIIGTCSLYVEAKQFSILSPTLDSWLRIIYLVKFQQMYLIFDLKTSLNYIIQSNNLPQIRINV